MKAYCNVSISSITEEPSHNSLIISQILYGEKAEIISTHGDFAQIKMDFDGTVGWVDKRNFLEQNSEEHNLILQKNFIIFDVEQGKNLLSIGSEVNFEIENCIDTENISQSIAIAAKKFLNVPYLYGGRSFFGTDESGFIQLIFKIHGINLPRTPEKMAELGTVLDFIHEVEDGDLAFFEENSGRIVHAGILTKNAEIIHCDGKVRQDLLDSTGIFNQKNGLHSHRLRFIKRMTES